MFGKRFWALALAIIILSPTLATAGPEVFTWDDAFAVPTYGVTISDLPGGQNSGGPFKIEKDGALLETFCVEAGQTISLPGPYDITGGGKTSSTTNRILTNYGAWVYETYKTDAQIWNYIDTSLDRDNLLGSIQDAIWWSMQGKSPLDVFDNDLSRSVGYAVDEWESFTRNGTNRNDTLRSIGTALKRDWGLDLESFLRLGIKDSDVSNVVVYNITKEGAPMQDMIGFAVPEPTAMLVWSLLAGGGCGLAAIRRRRGWSPKNREAIQEIFRG